MSCAAPLNLSADESRLFDDVCAGARHDAKGAQISAETIRYMLLGLPVTIGKKLRRSKAPQGVLLRNAVITGRLDLRNARLGDCCPLPALLLEGCVVGEEINLACASLARLSLQDSRITRLKAIECLIDGPVNLERITTAEDIVGEPGPIRGKGADGRGLCTVDFAGSLINGSFFASGAQCCVGTSPQTSSQFGPESDPGSGSSSNSSAQPWKDSYALNLRACRVKGSVMLENRFLAHGGVCLAEAHVEGDVWARGASLCAVHARSLHACSIVVEGSLVLAECEDDSHGHPHPFQSEGAIDLYGARINNTLNMSGSRLAAGPRSKEALDATSLHVGQTAFLDNLHSDIAISLHGAHVGMGLQMVSADLKQGMNATSAKIGGDVVLGDSTEQFRAAGQICFWGADIKLSFTLESARLDGPLVMNDVQIGGKFSIVSSELGELQAKGIRVDGNVRLAGSVKRPMRIAAKVDFDDAQIGADLEFDNLRFECQEKDPSSYIILSLKEACIDGALKVRGIESGHQNVDDGPQPVSALRLPFYRRNLPFWSSVFRRRWYLVEHIRDTQVRSYLWDGRNRVRHLDGSARVIHEMNEAQHLVLTKDDLGIYLRFFCGHIQGEGGQPFRLIGVDDLGKPEFDKDEDTETIREEIKKAVADGVREVDAAFRSSGVVLYDKAIFRSEFRIYPDGRVEMVDDTPLVDVKKSSREYSGAHHAMYGSWEDWRQEDPRAGRFSQAVEKHIRARKFEVDLTHARAARLDDEDGLAWGTDLSMKLEGFTYRQSPPALPEDQLSLGEQGRSSGEQKPGDDSRTSSDGQGMKSPAVQDRLVHRLVRGFRGYPPARSLKGRIDAERHEKRGCWLFLQYKQAEPAGCFSPQPFEAAAAAYRRDGHADEAWRIRAYGWNARFQTQTWFNRMVHWEPQNSLLASAWLLLRWPLWAVISPPLTLFRYLFWRVPYDYGRSFGGALVVIAVLLGLGVWGVKFANHTGLLANSETAETPRVACGDSINEWVYATDLLIPLVDLGEESRCRIRNPNQDDAGKSWLEHPASWSIAKGIYGILGWVVISLAIVIRTGAFEQLVNARGARSGD